jgi:hypothetical protein
LIRRRGVRGRCNGDLTPTVNSSSNPGRQPASVSSRGPRDWEKPRRHANSVEWSDRTGGGRIKRRRRGRLDATAASTGNVKGTAPPDLWSAPRRSGGGCYACALTATLDRRRIGLAPAQRELEAFIVDANILERSGSRRHVLSHGFVELTVLRRPTLTS